MSLMKLYSKAQFVLSAKVSAQAYGWLFNCLINHALWSSRVKIRWWPALWNRLQLQL